MFEIQAAYYMVAATGILIAAIYYVYNLRNTRKTHELQVTMQVLALFSNKDFWKELDEMMNREWGTLDEYHKKYGKTTNSFIIFPTFEELGVLLKKKLIDASVPWDLFGSYILLVWEKYKPIIMELRKDVAPDMALWTEHLVNEVRRYAAEHPESQVLPGSK